MCGRLRDNGGAGAGPDLDSSNCACWRFVDFMRTVVVGLGAPGLGPVISLGVSGNEEGVAK